MAKFIDSNGLLYLWSKIKSAFVAKVEGKGLSTNDLTNELVTKLDDAYKNIFSGNYSDLSGKPTIPSRTSELTNDSGYQNAAQVAAAISAAGHLHREIVATLPDVSTADANTIYMVPIAGTSSDNKYVEWMAINGVWEKVGDSDVDLSGYWRRDDLSAMTNAEIDTIAAS